MSIFTVDLVHLREGLEIVKRNDQNVQSSGSRLLVHRLSTLAALAAGAGYLAWRVLFTIGSAPLWLGLPMLVLEVWGYGLLAGMLYRAWPRSTRPRASADLGVGTETTADIVITAGACDVGQLERTLVGCDSLDSLVEKGRGQSWK